MSHSAKTKCTNQIREVRKKRGLLLRDMAILTDLSGAAHISHWEKGRKAPSLRNALVLSAALQCPVEILFLELFKQVRKEVYETKNKHNINLTYS